MTAIYDILRYNPIQYNCLNPKFAFYGVDEKNNNISLPIDEDLLSKHFLLLGGIGTGKTNTFFQIIQQIRQNMVKDDIVIIFDTKGDFYEKFY